MTQKILLALAFALLQYGPVFCQQEAEKWGKIPPADLSMTVYPQDSGAAAVILQDVGSVRLQDYGKYTVVFRQHRRIKVFDVSAFQEGNLLIPYYSHDGLERIADLDVQLVLPNGDIQKVTADNVFTEKISKYWSARKVFIPNLQKGCIIEYRFELRSEAIHVLHDWYFQDELPVRWSELNIYIPPFFTYVMLMRVPHTFDVEETKTQLDNAYTRYGLRHLPAIRPEPFMTTLDDYRAHIGFQLGSVAFPSRAEEKFMTTWSDLAKEMEKWEDFGLQYKREGKSGDLWKQLAPQLRPDTDPADSIARQVLRFVGSHIKWNGEYRYTLDGSLDDAFQRRTGSSAELNLALVALLRRAGLDAVPMLVSTRHNGEMYPLYPFRRQFNSVVAYLRQGNSGLVLDATDPYLPVGELSAQHNNGTGWLVDSDRPVWVDLKPPVTSATWYGQLRLDEAGALTGKFSINVTGALAADWRSTLAHATEQNFLKAHFATRYPDIVFDSIMIGAQADNTKPLKIGFNCQIANAANVVNDFIYCQPVLDFFVDENPFKSLQRSFPVDFPYAVKMNYVLTLQLPAGYAVEEMPAEAHIALAGEAGKINFSCSKASAQSVLLQLRMNLAKTEFAPEEYSALRKFFDLAAEKTQLQLVLKRG